MSTTATDTATVRTKTVREPSRPSDSVKSTWRTADKSTWNMYHWLIHSLNVYPTDLDKPVPIHQKTDPVPYLPDWYAHRFILVHAAIPILLHQAYISYFGSNPHIVLVYFLYSSFININAIHEIQIFRRMGHKYGFLDGDKHERDGVPDVAVKKLFISLFQASHVRPMLAVILSFSADQFPSSMRWSWLIPEIICYSLAVDFWFYWYHRLMHDSDSLWKFHRTHHLTKHPSPMLSLYADSVQEIFDVIIIPLLGFGSLKLLGFPMGFYETWVCYQYVLFTEVLGHCGLRIHATAPSPISFIYRFFDIDGVVEDHDLHHRTGWRKSHNYGKHCGLWDTIFRTKTGRVEGLDDNIDYVNTASMDLF